VRRRLAATAGIAALLLSTLLATAGSADDESEWRVYLDRFDEQRFDGNNGSHEWSGPWTEVGENDGPESGGAVWVWPHSYCSDGTCLKMGGRNDISGIGVVRTADLDNADDAKLCFEVRRHLLGEPSDAFVRVAISDDAGETWTTLKKYRLDRDDAEPRKEIIDISDHVGAKTVLAFIGDGGWAASYITFDNIELAGLIGRDDTPTTTASTTTAAPPTTTAAPPPPTTAASTTTTRPPATTTVAPRTTTEPPQVTTTTLVPNSTPAPVRVVADPREEGLDDVRFTSKDAMTVTAIGRNLNGPDDGDRPELVRSPIEVMASTVEIAAATVRSYALETFALALFIAWLSLRGLSHVGARDELLSDPVD
jgi:hypothetical protein